VSEEILPLKKFVLTCITHQQDIYIWYSQQIHLNDHNMNRPRGENNGWPLPTKSTQMASQLFPLLATSPSLSFIDQYLGRAWRWWWVVSWSIESCRVTLLVHGFTKHRNVLTQGNTSRCWLIQTHGANPLCIYILWCVVYCWRCRSVGTMSMDWWFYQPHARLAVLLAVLLPVIFDQAKSRSLRKALVSACKRIKLLERESRMRFVLFKVFME